MNRKTLAFASAALVAAMAAVSLAVGGTLPAGGDLPVHWNMAGEADGFAPKWVALLLPPAIAAALALLFYFLPSLEPRQKGLERSQGLYLWGWAACLFVCAVIEFVTVATALDWGIRVDRLIVGAVGVMLVMIGNQLGKSRSMYLIGLRTPWTLASEEVWIKTHRLAGKLMVGSGFAVAAAALSPLSGAPLTALLLGIVLVAAGVPAVYSYLLWRRERSDQPSA
jgi:uncharacterized membrane protein